MTKRNSRTLHRPDTDPDIQELELTVAPILLAKQFKDAELEYDTTYYPGTSRTVGMFLCVLISLNVGGRR